MAQHCPRCQRANPGEAVFCFFDGCLLEQGASEGSGVFLQEFVFPSGRRCRTFDELVQGIHEEWEDARELLREGTFASFLGGLGRADLVRAAREAQTQADTDIALTNLVRALPAMRVQGPRLGLHPRRLLVGPLRVGEQRVVSLRVVNEGNGILQGRATVAEGGWIELGDSGDGRTVAVHARREQSVNVRVDTTGLVVGQNYAAKLVLVTNGGVAEVPIRLELIARPFARGPYQGALSPHELARKMRDQPHPAVELLESGEIARWFESNGWTYPIAGATAPGLAAVQQYFEELGLARAPQIQLSEQEIRVTVRSPETVERRLTLRSPARKLVYGRAESDSPWLKVKTAGVSGQMQATIEISIDSSELPEDKLYEGSLKVVANAGQTFQVRVLVEVQGSKKGWFGRVASGASTPAVEAPSAGGTSSVPMWIPKVNVPAVSVRADSWRSSIPSSEVKRPSEAEAREGKRGQAGGVQMMLVGALLGLVFRLGLLIPADLYARLLGTMARESAAGAVAFWQEVPSADEGFLRLLVQATWWVGAVVGGLCIWRAGGRWTDLICGVLAGAVAGVAGAATAGSLLVVGDALPRVLLGAMLGGREVGWAIATPLWMVMVLGCWTLLGGVIGLLLVLLGKAGRRALDFLTSPVAAFLHLLGLGGMARVFELGRD